MAEAPTESTPRVWVLLGEGAGGNAQMIALAKALGWGYETRQLSWNVLNHLPNPLIGARAFTLDRHADALRPPWPNLIIAASRRAAPIALWIKAQSGGQTRLVHLLHTQMPLANFDLVLTLAQFRVPAAANVVCNTLPLNVIDEESQAAAVADWQARLSSLPKPWLGVLVGGNSSSHTLGGGEARALAARVCQGARRDGGSLLVTTSRRTPAEAADALFEAIDVPAECYRWRPDADTNPYPAFLALADRFVVTGDSASLAAEAVATGRPVDIFEWASNRPARRTPALFQPFVSWAIASGWYKPRRDFAAFHQCLRAHDLVDTDQPARPPDDMARAVSRIRALFDD